MNQFDNVVDPVGTEIQIGDAAESALFSRDKLARYAATASQDAIDYEVMAVRHREQAEQLAKQASQRSADADFYERRIAELFPNQEAAK